MSRVYTGGMKKKSKKSRMTIDDLARMTQGEFQTVRRQVATGLEGLASVTRGEFIAVRDEMSKMKGEIVEEVGRKVIESNDRVATKLDTIITDLAAHDSLHKRITDDLHDHDTRIKKLEKARTA